MINPLSPWLKTHFFFAIAYVPKLFFYYIRPHVQSIIAPFHSPIPIPIPSPMPAQLYKREVLLRFFTEAKNHICF